MTQGRDALATKWSSVEGPAGTVLATQQFVSLRAIGHATGGGIVLELFADAIGHNTQKHHLDRRAAVIEITTGFQVALTRINPFPLEVSQWRNHLIFRPPIVIGQVRVVAERKQNPRIEIKITNPWCP